MPFVPIMRCSISVIASPSCQRVGLDARPRKSVEAYYLQRTRFESIAERKIRGRQLTEDGNVEIGRR